MKNITKISIFAFCLLFASMCFAEVKIFTGFENGSSEQFQNSAGGSFVNATAAITGNYGLQSNTVGAATFGLVIGGITAQGSVSPNANLTNGYVQLDFKLPSLPSAEEPIFGSLNTGGGPMIRYTVDSSGILRAYNNPAGTYLLAATGTTPIVAGTKYTACYKSQGGTSGFFLQINGVTELSGTVNQTGGPFGFAMLGKFTNMNSANQNIYIDNVIISDTGCLYTAGGAVQKVKRLMPTANSSVTGFAQWTGGTNSSNYLETIQIPTDNDTTYIASNGSTNQKHYVELEDTSTAGISGTILSVYAYSTRREASSGTSSGQVSIYSNLSTADTTAEDITTTYTQRQKLSNTDPATGTAWTTSGVDNMQIGVIESNAIVMRGTQLNAQVLYEESVATPTPTATATATITPTSSGFPCKISLVGVCN